MLRNLSERKTTKQSNISIKIRSRDPATGPFNSQGIRIIRLSSDFDEGPFKTFDS